MTLISGLLILSVGGCFGILTAGLMSANGYDERCREVHRKGWLEGYSAGYTKGKEEAQQEGEELDEPNQ